MIGVGKVRLGYVRIKAYCVVIEVRSHYEPIYQRC